MKEIGVVVVQKNLYREREEGVESSLLRDNL